MPDNPLTRRDLIVTTGAAAALTALKPASGQPAAPPLAKPVAVGSTNALAAVARAVERMQAGDAPLDAAVAGVAIVEADPDEIGVGYGGLPNEDGVVQLDAAVMDGTTMRAGAVASLERIMHPAQVAAAVMRHTDRLLLVGEGALKFAHALGFKEENLLTERARKIWLLWKENAAPKDDWIPDPKELNDPDIKWFINKVGDSYFRPQGTIHVSALAADGTVGCSTSTSGLFFKIAGRVGDSPIIGAGLYCDGEVGSAGATGHGEASIISQVSATAVEHMRQGKSPEAACLAALERVARNTRSAIYRDKQGRPRNGVSVYALNLRGEVGGATIWSGGKYTYCRAGERAKRVDAAYLYRGRPAS
jgi:N4-(beta-N-acetylglucosaminyl)-L-asparaginase